MVKAMIMKAPPSLETPLSGIPNSVSEKNGMRFSISFLRVISVVSTVRTVPRPQNHSMTSSSPVWCGFLKYVSPKNLN